MASIFFTERLPGISIFQTAGSLRVVRKVIRSSVLATAGHTAQLPVSTTIQSRLPQKQGLCQVVRAPDFWNVIRLLTGIGGGFDRRAHNTEAYEIGKQINQRAIVAG
jgi:hypothetical protein